MKKVLLRTFSLVTLLAVLFSAFSAPVEAFMPSFFPGNENTKALRDATAKVEDKIHSFRNLPKKNTSFPDVNVTNVTCSTITQVVTYSGNSVQHVTLPAGLTGTVTIKAVGANGGNSMYYQDLGGVNVGGKGAYVEGKFSGSLVSGQTLNIITGQRGGDEYPGSDAFSAGGGGGTFVSINNNLASETGLLVVAGGGGGGGFSGEVKITGLDINNDPDANPVTNSVRATRGNYGADDGGGGPYSVAAGYGGGAGRGSGGGAGLHTDGEDGDLGFLMGGRTPANGAAGGTAQSGTNGEYGGYGGGGASNFAGGGGGGFSGGAGGGDFGYGGGGGSFLNANATFISSGKGTSAEDLYNGDGYVVITYEVNRPILAIYGNNINIPNQSMSYNVADGTDFGTVGFPSTTTHTFTVKNTGGSTLTVSMIDAGTSAFSIVGFSPMTIAPGATSTFNVKFVPQAAGEAIGYVGISSDDPCMGAFTFKVRGFASASTPLAPGTIGAPQTVCSGTTPAALTSLTAATGGTGTINYQWQSSTDNSNFTNIPGATAAGYAPGALTTTTYFRRGASTASDAVQYTSSVQITVIPVSVAGTITGGGGTVCTGTNSTALTLGGYTGTIQWQSSSDNNTFTNIGGATNASYTASNLTATTYYRAVVTNGICASVNASSVVVTVSPASVAGNITGSSPVCEGTNSRTLTLNNYTGAIQWQSSTDNSTFTNIAGANAATYTATNLTVTTYYRAVVTSGVCAAATSNAVSIVVNAKPVVNNVFGATNICQGTSTTLQAFTQLGSLNTKWFDADNNIVSQPDYTFNTPVLNATTTYYIEATSTAGCVSNKTPVTVTVKPTPATPVVTVVDNCNGTSTLSTTASGTLAWSNGATTSSITVASAGTYTVTQTVNGCVSAAGSGVAAPKTKPATPVVTVVDNCNGTSTLSTTANGTLAWSNGATTSSITVSSAGTYTVTQTVNGCNSDAGSGVAAPKTKPSTPAVTVVDNCNGTSTLSTTASGTLAWSNGATTSSITVASAGTYTVTQTVNGCTSDAGSGVAAPKTKPSTPVVTVVDNCNGTSTLSTTANGTLAWSNGATTSSITVASAGTYTVTQTVNGCTSDAGSGVAAPKTKPSTPVVTVVDNCNGTSTLSTTANGTLAWSNGATTSSITVSSAGTYTVTQTVNGCTSDAGSGAAAPKTKPSTPVVTVVDNCNGTSTLSTTATGTLAWSNGATTSSITVASAGTYTVTQTVNGCVSAAGSGVAAPKTKPATPVVTVVDNCNGTSTLSTTANGTLAWSNGATTSSITVSSAGTYTVTQTVNGCTSDAGSGVAAPKTKPSTPVVTVVDNCNGTSTLSTTATGTLAWSNGATTSSITVSSAGTYTVMQTVNGCTSDAGSGVAAPKTKPATPVVTVVDNCNGTSTLSTTASGTLAWSNGATTSSITVLSAGTYTVTQTVNGCTSDAGFGLAAPKTKPSTPAVTVVDNCNGTSTLSTNATGTLAWSNGSSSASITVSSAGTYTVTASVNGCTSDAGSGVAAPKTRPDVLTYTTTNNCDGTSTVSINNATNPVIWSPNGETTNSIIVSVAGTYGAVQTAANGCQSNAAPITVTPVAVPVTYNVGGGAALCSNQAGTVNITLSGSQTGVTYALYRDGATLVATKPGTGAAFAFTAPSSVYTAGTYTVVATKAGLPCTFNMNGSAAVTVKPAPVITITAPANPCAGTTAAISASATGTGLSYSWHINSTYTEDEVATTSSFNATFLHDTSFYVIVNDANGCASIKPIFITVKPTPAASITADGSTSVCPGSTVTLHANTGSGYTYQWFNGASPISGAGNADYTAAATGSYSVVISNNGCSSAASNSIAVTVADHVAPVTPVLPNITAECYATATAPTTTDACAGTITGTTSDPLTYTTQGDHIIHWTFTDPSGNTTTADQHVIITDLTKPAVVCPANITAHATTTGSGYGANVAFTATATDNCGTPVISYDHAPGSYFPVGTTVVTVTANDGNGNTNTCQFNVTVIAPEIDIKGNGVSIVDGDTTPATADNTDFGSTLPGSPIVKTFTIHNTGNDDLHVTALSIGGVDAASFTASGFSPITLAPGASTSFNITFLSTVNGVKNATVNVLSDDNDESNYDFAITANINCATPVFTACPSDITKNTDAGLCSAVVNYTSTVTGVPAPSVSYAFTGATTGSGSGTGSGATFNKGVTTVTITANNACGNVVCTFKVTVEDHESPVIVNVPSNINKSNDAGQCGAIVTWTLPTATDNCPVVTLVSDRHSGDVFPIGTTTVHYTATDASGNTASASFDITVTDNENPIISVPADVTHTADAGLCSYKFANTIADQNTVTPDGSHTPGYGPTAILLGTATGSDNCGAVTVSGVRSDGLALTDPYPVGTTTVTWTVIDSHGHAVTGTQTVVITDDESPVIHNLPANITRNADANSCGAAVNWTAPTATDNCAVTLTSDHQPGDVFPIGTTTVTYTATDNHGHVTTGSFNVTVNDAQAPTIACPADITVAGQPNKNGANVTYTATATDNCGTPTLTYSIEPGTLFPIGTTAVTATATDANGNHVSCTFNVTVTNNPPVANPDVNTTNEDTPVSGNVLTNDTDVDGHTLTVTGFSINSVNYAVGATASFTEGTIVLNANGTYTYTPAPDFNGAVPVVTYSITDGHGGTASSTLTINVIPVNDVPVAVNDAASVNEDEVLHATVATNDTQSGDGGNVWSVVTTTTHGTLVFNADGSYTYTPNANFNGTDSFTYKLCDVDGDCSTATVTITVVSVNDVPVAVNDAASVNEDEVLHATVVTNDTQSGDGGNVWSVVTTTTHGTLVFNADGSYTYTPNANFNGTDSFTYKLCDVDGDCSTATVTITVVSVNDVPVAVNDAASVNEDEVLHATVATNDTQSGDGGNVWSVVTTTTHGTLVFNADGSYTYTPNANFHGTDSFTYKLCDVDGDCSTATVTITVVSVNDVPVAVNDAASVNEDEVLHATVVTNDTQSGDGGNVWSVVTTTTHGTLVFNADGSYTYTPNANFNGTDSFTYKLCDVDGDCSTATVTITVVSVNDVPVAVNDAASVNEDEVLHATVATNDTQSGDGGNVWSVVTTTTHGTLVFNADGSYTYTPNANFNGTDSFTYKLCDVDGDCSTATVTITVVSVNDVPVAVNDAASVNEDEVLHATVATNDTQSGDGGNVWSVVTTTTHGTLVFNADGSYTYTPNANFNGTDSFTYKLCDVDGDCSTATVTITVVSVNDVPVAVNDAASVNEDEVLHATVATNDTQSGDGGNVWSVVTTTTHGTLVFNADGSYTYTPNANFNGTDSFTYKLCDVDGDCSTATVTITVVSVNDVPVAVNDAASVNEDEVLHATVATNDTQSGDGGNVWSVVTTTTHGTLVFNADGSYTYTPNANFNGTDSFTYKLCDVDGDCSTATVTITVVSVNDVPVAVNDAASVNEDEVLHATVATNDTQSGDGGNVWSVVTTTTHGTLVFNADGSYTYTPNANFNGTDSFTYKLCDVDGDCSTATVTITVVSVNDVPVAVNDAASVNEDEVLHATVATNDTQSGDGGNVWSVVTTTTHGTLVFNADGSYTYTPNANFNGTDSFTYKLCDVDGDCSTATVTITVVSVNDVPVAVNDAASTNEDVVLHASVNGNDTPSPDGGNVWSVVTTTTHGTLVFNADGSYTYTPNANFHGTDSFTYKLCDVDGDCSTATVTITVVPVDDPAVMKVKNITVYVDANGHVSITAGQIDDGSYDPDGIASLTLNRTNFSCSDIASSPNTVTLTLVDNDGNSTSANATVTVLDIIPPTIVCPAAVTVQCASAVPAPNTALVTAADNCSVLVSFVSDVISNQTAPNKYTITRTYKAVDPSGNSATCTQIITVNDNTAPTLIVAGSLPGNSAGQCLGDVPAAPSTTTIAALYTDNCGGSVTAVLTNTTTTGNNASGWVRKYFYTISDASGNQTTACVTYSGKDTQAPVPTTATLPTVTAQCYLTVVPPTATDNCAGLIHGTTSGSLNFTEQGTYTITWTYNDGNGNTSTQNQTVIVKDVTAPVINCPSDITVTANVTEAGQPGAQVTYTVTASDNCGVQGINYSKASGSFFPVGTTVVTATAYDVAGNTTTCTFKVIVNCTAPSFTTCPSNKTVNTDAGLCSAVVTYTSAATGTQPISCNYTFTGATTGSGTGNGSGKVFNKGTTTVTITATNLCGVTATCSFTVTVVDNEKPVIVNLPANITKTNDAGVCGAVVSWPAAYATDNCPGVVISANHAQFETFPVGTTTVTYTATDASGNTSTGSFNVTVTDTEKPVFTCPNDITLTANTTISSVVGAIANYGVTAYDNCGVQSVVYSIQPGSLFPVGTTPVTVTVKDVNGNTSTCTFNVTVGCVTPVFTVCPSNKTVNTDAGLCSAVVTYTSTATAMPAANCTYTFTGATTGSGTGNGSGKVFNKGTTTVTIKATNLCGSATCSFTVTVVDSEKPVIVNLPSNITKTNDAGVCGAVVSWPAASATDNCPGVVISANHAQFETFPVGTTTVTYTATDASGNTATGSFTVTVTDTEKPTVACPANISLTANTTVSGVQGAAAYYGVTPYDNCGVQSTVFSIPSGSFFPVGTTAVTVTVKDVNGNISTCTFNVTVTCGTPVFSACPSNITKNTDAGLCSAAVTYTTTATATPAANCTYTFTGATTGSGSGNGSGKTFNKGTTTVTVTASNLCGTATCSFTVTVVDSEKPVITCPASVTIACGLATTPANAGTATATDNCGAPVITYSDVVNGNTTTRTWKATDAAGNFSTCTQTITQGGPFTATIASVPTNTTYTGGGANTLFIGYGAQSSTLQASVPAGSTYTYVWSGSDAAMLSNTNTANPVFTPTRGGSFTFTATITNALGCVTTATISICVTDIRVFATATVPNNNNNCGHQSHYSWNCPHSGHGHSCTHYSHSSYNCPDKEDTDDRQGMCNHSSHSSYECPHRGHNHSCDHRTHSSYNCAHRSCNDRDDDDDRQKTCDHKSHAASDCSHRGHNHNSCNHQSHSASNCGHSKNNGSDQKVCDHKSHSSGDCNHGGHNHGNCNHKSHNAGDCPHNGDGGNGGTDDDDEKKVYICHVPPGNPSQRQTLSIGVSAVAAHLANHPGDRLGSCDQAPCTGYTDNVKPTIDCSDNVTIAYGASTSPVATGSPEADDNSGDVVITYSDASTKGSDASTAAYYNYVITRTWKATDLAGNFATCAQLITVQETTKPVITNCPASVTVACGSTAPAVTGTATATDNSGVVNVTYTDAVSGNKTTRTWKAADPSGNYVTCVQTITVIDNVKPVVTTPNDITVNCGSSTAPAATGTAIGSDNCSNVTITYSDSWTGSYKLTRTWKATDATGNYATAAQVIMIVDNVKPTISVPADKSISCGASTAPAYCNGSATATDNCSGVTITYSDSQSGNVITRTWKATDASGNVATDTQIITIIDNVKPVISDVRDITISCGTSTTPQGCGSVATATDNCSTPVVTYSDETSGNTITRTWKATDAAGNVATSTQIITIIDNTKPVITTVAAKTAVCGATDPSATGTATATDACSTPVVTYTDAWTASNKITRTWKATDAAGNFATSTQVITVTDNVKPVITAPGDLTVTCSSLTAPATTGTAVATDNCSNVTLTYSDVTSGNKITRTWKATDAAGNYATDAQVITVIDNVKPTITTPNDITISCSASTTPSYCGGSATGSDNCSSVTITYTDSKVGNVITRTWKATDASGNFVTDTQTITIIDNVKPVISDVRDITISCGTSTTPTGCGSVATATDNCGTPMVSYSDETVGNKITRTWTATDAAGNVATSTQIITIVDNTKPVLTEPNDITINCNGSTAPSATGMATATDNCSTPAITYTDTQSGNVITRTWKATDAAGNWITDVQYITIGSAFSAVVSSVPTNSTYTGGVSTNLFIGYGAQSTTLTMCSLPSAGAPYTYAWSGTFANKLSSTTAASPLFTPGTNGYYTFNVTVTNKYGCTSSTSISICVTDIRVPGTNGAKVYICHTPYGKNKTPQTLQVAVNQVSQHLNTSSCGSDGNDRLGSCDQAPCNNVVMLGTVAKGNTATKESSEEVITTEEELKVTVMPNPTTTFFTLKLESKYETPVNMRVMDANGRVVDAKTKIGSNSTIQIGHNYSSGTYYAELIQGTKRKVIPLIKARG